MNVVDFTGEIFPEVTMIEFLALREPVFKGFVAVEQSQGGFDLDTDISDPRAQDYMRLLFGRMMEEFYEVQSSGSSDHFREELIDIINFATGMAFLTGVSAEGWMDWDMTGHSDHDGEWFGTRPSWIEGLESSRYPNLSDDTHQALGNLMYYTTWDFGKVLERLRNRSWQNGVQSPNFSGSLLLNEALIELFIGVSRFFDSREQFTWFLMAKHRVLEFRLESNY